MRVGGRGEGGRGGTAGEARVQLAAQGVADPLERQIRQTTNKKKKPQLTSNSKELSCVVWIGMALHLVLLSIMTAIHPLQVILQPFLVVPRWPNDRMQVLGHFFQKQETPPLRFCS